MKPSPRVSHDDAAFESCRPELLGLAYRMLGDLGRAEDVVQDAWIRWRGSAVAVRVPRAYLVTIVTRLCLNELRSARARREEARADRLPEPVDLAEGRLGRVEAVERISMAFLVLLQRLTPAERAVLLLHEVFDYEHAEIATMMRRSEAACRQLLRRAKENVAVERRVLDSSPDEHRRLLRAFARAATAGRVDDLVSLLAEDAVLIADAGPAGGTFGGARNLGGPLRGARRIAAFTAAITPRGSRELRVCDACLNGEPALLVVHDDAPFAAILVAVALGRIESIWICADRSRLGRVRVPS